MTPRELWCAVYVAAIRAGNSCGFAERAANEAVKSLRVFASELNHAAV